MNGNISIGTVGCLVIIMVIIGYFAYKFYKEAKTEAGAEESLQIFFNSIREAAEEAMIKYLQYVDIHNITNISDMQKQVLNDLYDTIWNLCVEKLGEEVDPDVAKLLKALLTRDVVEAFIQEVYETSIEVQETVTTKYNSAVLTAANK